MYLSHRNRLKSGLKNTVKTKPIINSKETFDLIKLCPVQFVPVKEPVKRQFTGDLIQHPLKSMARYPVSLN